MTDPLERSPCAYVIPPEEKMGLRKCCGCGHDYHRGGHCQEPGTFNDARTIYRWCACPITTEVSDEQAPTVSGETPTEGTAVAASVQSALAEAHGTSEIRLSDCERCQLALTRLRALEQRMRERVSSDFETMDRNQNAGVRTLHREKAIAVRFWADELASICTELEQP